MIRTLYIDPKGKKTRDLAPEAIQSALKEKRGLLWVSLECPDQDEGRLILRDLFQFHPLAIEDSMNEGYQTPKVDDYGSYIFIIFHVLKADSHFEHLETSEINIFLGENYMVTVFLQPESRVPVDRLWQRLEKDERLLQNGSDFLCHGLLDIIVDDYMPVLDHLDNEMETLEDQVLEKPQPQVLEKIMAQKHTLMSMRRIISPQREVMNRLSRDEFPMIDRQSKIYFRDIYDHLVRFQDLSESLRDVVSGTMDIYLNSTSLRLNEVMKALTIVSTIFLPLSFLAGVYGMNFTIFPELHWRYGIVFFWGVCLAVVVGMLWMFKRRGWF